MVGPALRSRNISVIAGISREGVVQFEVLDGSGNAVRFLHFVDDLGHE